MRGHADSGGQGLPSRLERWRILLSYGHKRHSIRRQPWLFEEILQVLRLTSSDTLKLAAFNKLFARINASCLKQPKVNDVAANVCRDKRVRHEVRKRVDHIQHGDVGVPRYRSEEHTSELQSRFGI